MKPLQLNTLSNTTDPTCPECDGSVEISTKYTVKCPHCGTRLKWNDKWISLGDEAKAPYPEVFRDPQGKYLHTIQVGHRSVRVVIGHTTPIHKPKYKGPECHIESEVIGGDYWSLVGRKRRQDRDVTRLTVRRGIPAPLDSRVIKDPLA